MHGVSEFVMLRTIRECLLIYVTQYLYVYMSICVSCDSVFMCQCELLWGRGGGRVGKKDCLATSQSIAFPFGKKEREDIVLVVSSPSKQDSLMIKFSMLWKKPPRLVVSEQTVEIIGCISRFSYIDVFSLFKFAWSGVLTPQEQLIARVQMYFTNTIHYVSRLYHDGIRAAKARYKWGRVDYSCNRSFQYTK